MNTWISKKLWLAAAVASISFGAATQAWAESFVMVVNDSVAVQSASISKDELKRIYLGQTDSVFGQKINPISLKDDDAFITEVLGMNADELKQYWIKESLKGGARPPRAMSSADALVLYVQKKPGTIGYLSKSAAASHSGIKALDVQ